MLTLFKSKKAKVVKTVEVKQLEKAGLSTAEIIEQIHNEFDSSADKLLAEAKLILDTAHEYDEEKLQLMKELGFTSYKPLAEKKQNDEAKAAAMKQSEVVKMYSEKYPNNKFITKDQVSNICKKYGLVCGKVDRYIGEVPRKNLLEIAAFKPAPEDVWYFEEFSGGMYYSVPDVFKSHQGVVNSENYEKRTTYDRHGMNFYSKNYHYSKVPFYICAPYADMNTENSRIENGLIIERTIPDPIVLHYVGDGFLIVSKWGLEADIEI